MLLPARTSKISSADTTVLEQALEDLNHSMLMYNCAFACLLACLHIRSQVCLADAALWPAALLIAPVCSPLPKKITKHHRVQVALKQRTPKGKNWLLGAVSFSLQRILAHEIKEEGCVVLP